MAGLLRRLRGGDPAALGGLMWLCFAYGFFHAAGPGHGKVLIAGYGVGRPVSVLRLSALALAASLAQAGSAVVLVYAGVLMFQMARAQLETWAEAVLAPASYAMVAAVGLWLMLRGLRHWRQSGPAQQGHDDAGGQPCGCGHSHGPTPDAVARAQGWRDMAVLVGAVALRPCTGAVFLLLLTWQMGIAQAGVLGAIAMGLGTASVTILVAIAAVGLRAGVLQGLAGQGARLSRGASLLEFMAGLMVVLVAGQLALRAL
jgi:ABC-type nickel/cobalt efflux system permease component RcnA